MLIISKTYQVDRSWSSITVDKYPKPIRVDIISKTYQVDRSWSSIRVDKYPRSIKLIDLGVLSLSINIQDISS